MSQVSLVAFDQFSCLDYFSYVSGNIIELRDTDPPLKWILALLSSAILFSLIVAIALYKGWVYEQELDSLMWKIDMKDVINSDIPLVSKSNKVYHSRSLIRKESD